MHRFMKTLQKEQVWISNDAISPSQIPPCNADATARQDNICYTLLQEQEHQYQIILSCQDLATLQSLRQVATQAPRSTANPHQPWALPEQEPQIIAFLGNHHTKRPAMRSMRALHLPRCAWHHLRRKSTEATSKGPKGGLEGSRYFTKTQACSWGPMAGREEGFSKTPIEASFCGGS